jgi:hypothetical protein
MSAWLILERLEGAHRIDTHQVCCHREKFTINANSPSRNAQGAM